MAQGTLIKDSYTANEGSVFPGTGREYQIYLPAGFDKSRPAHFMVFQDGVIYKAPVVFDNLIAKKDIPPLVGIFIKPGVVPAANDNALPRFNRSYEYDSITDTYSTFLIDEFLPAIEKKHGLQLSRDPNHAAISGNSSGGICAFMVAWHRPDRFRRVFTGVGTYVGIHGADQLPVLVRKFEPKPLRIFLQSGTGDNNLYCGDWWMANQMMERSLTWAGYDVNHAWGEGGHNQKHASQIFPDVLRWLWRDWLTDIEVKANPKGESKWKGYEVVEAALDGWKKLDEQTHVRSYHISPSIDGHVFALDFTIDEWKLTEFFPTGGSVQSESQRSTSGIRALNETMIIATKQGDSDHNFVELRDLRSNTPVATTAISGGDSWSWISDFVVAKGGLFILSQGGDQLMTIQHGISKVFNLPSHNICGRAFRLALSPDQTTLYATDRLFSQVSSFTVDQSGSISHSQLYARLDTWPGNEGRVETKEGGLEAFKERGLCVDTEGRLYVATSLGIQVCDQAGRVNFIIPTLKPPLDVCFGGKDLSELFIACGDAIYKRPMKVRGVVSGQQAPIKPAAPKL
ncbi:alpha/beta hydrolase-fold protein [Prosthecobacter sp. SYSU 5D2]|uniref:alpha/beta hydrolase-fold protein n=1 Tax=Prosthecobacter sp. SYSU 5D2 TaxID=3134134 RepID=UPI0031FF2B42